MVRLGDEIGDTNQIHRINDPHLFTIGGMWKR